MRRLVFVLLLQFAAACGQADDSASSDLNSVVLDSARSRWTQARSIPVCIVNRSAIADELYSDIKNYVTSEYLAKTGVGFTGWADCSQAQMKSSTIRVTFNLKHNWSTSASVVAGGGLSMVGMSSRTCGTDCVGGTMRLDVGSKGAYPAAGSRYRDFAVTRTRATAIHEFGHALGLMHEHERTDAVNCDAADGSVVAGSNYVYVGNYDSTSIMNYCHSGSITTLSKGDIAGVFYLYPSLAAGH